MSAELLEHHVKVAGTDCRIWEKGDGPPVAFLGGLGGVPRWVPFLDRLAESRRVIVVSPPGFPGSGDGHRHFQSYLDWLTATLDLFDEAHLDGVDLIGASVGGLLAAEVAAMSRHSVRRLVLAAPFGLYDVDQPGADPFAVTAADTPSLLTVHHDRYAGAFGPGDADPVEWAIMTARANDAAARILWPFGDRGLTRRLHRVTQPTLILWGAEDRILPSVYAKRYAELISGPTDIEILPGAGHLLLVDEAETAAERILAFLGD